ncbi:MAG: P1 family peptidase [Pseudomonadota bacterium]
MATYHPGPRNLITDIDGILIGHATDEKACTGVTVLQCEHRMTAAVDVRGGGPGTRETDVLAPENLVDQIDAIVLSGGSVFGLAAADGVTAELSHRGLGLNLSNGRNPAIPIVPAAILHDLGNAGDKNWGTHPPYQNLGREALSVVNKHFELGAVGAGKGARAGTFAGGIGSTSIVLEDDIVVGALVAVNPIGSAVLPDGITFYAWPYEQDGEFGNQAPPQKFDLSDPFPELSRLHAEGRDQARSNTTLAIVATSLELTRVELQRVAIMAQDGMARAIRPAHAPFDGDVVFAVSSATTTLDGEPSDAKRSRAVARIGSAAADCLARAIARGVFEAKQ